MLRTIIPVSISIQNFKAYVGEPVRVHLNYGPGLIFLQGRNDLQPRLGSNGASKTTVLDAVMWCLYGRTTKGQQNPAIKPWFGDKKTDVRLKLIVDKATREVARTTFPNTLRLDGVDVGQDAIDALMGVGHVVFKHTVLFGQGQELFFDMTPESKMQLFVDVMFLDRWDTRSDTAMARVREMQNEAAKWGGTVSTLEASAVRYAQERDRAKEAASIWDSERDAQLEQTRTDLEKWQQSVDALQTEYNGAATTHDMASTELDAYGDQLAKARTAKDNAARAVANAQQDIDIHKADVVRLDAAIAGLRAAKVCPVCKQTVGKGQLDAHRADLIKQRDTAKAAAGASVSVAIKNTAAATMKAFTTLDEAGKGLRDKVNAAGSKANQILPRLSDAEARVTVMQSNIDRWTKEGNPYTQQHLNARKAVTQCTTDLEAAKKAIRVANARERRAQFWVRGFKDVRLYEIEEMLQAYQLTANAMVADAGLVDWSILFDVETETAKGSTKRGLQVRIASPFHDQPVAWDSWSGGEQQRLRAIGALALSRCLLEQAGVDIPWLALDEPTTHLSIEGTRDMVDTLASYAEQAGACVWYVDHMAMKSNRFRRSVMVVNTDTGAHVE